MRQVEIYTTPFCGYCLAAKRLLTAKGISFAETDVSQDPGERRKMTVLSGGRMTVPQIFIGGTPIGGFEELHALDRSGRLDPMLAG